MLAVVMVCGYRWGNLRLSPMASTKDFLTEIGTSGIARAGGYLNWDWVPELVGMRGALSYREMAYSDALLHGMIYAVQMLLRRMPWRVEPADESAEAVKLAEEARIMLFDKLKKTPWSGVVADASTMIIYGYAPLELVYRRDKKSGAIEIDKIAYRAQTSVERWEFSDHGMGDEVLGLWQMPYTGPQVFIPMEKLVLCRTVLESGSPEGRSLLRGSYKYYMMKRVLEEGEGRKLVRSAGLVVGRAPLRWMTTEATDNERLLYQSFVSAVKKVADDRQAAIVLPSDLVETGIGSGGQGAKTVPMLDIAFVTNDSRAQVDFNPTIERYDKRMAASFLADWLLLGGGGSTGSWALSADKTSMFEHATGGLADIMEGEFQRSIIQRWMALNGYNEDRTPRLRHGNLSKRDLAALGSFVTSMTTAGYLTVSPSMRMFIREAGDLPEATKEELEAPVPQPAPPGGGGPPGSEGEGGGEQKAGPALKLKVEGATAEAEPEQEDTRTQFGDGTAREETDNPEDDDTDEEE